MNYSSVLEKTNCLLANQPYTSGLYCYGIDVRQCNMKRLLTLGGIVIIAVDGVGVKKLIDKKGKASDSYLTMNFNLQKIMRNNFKQEKR